MININEDKLVLLIENTLWAFDSYGYYYSNTKNYLEELLEDNSLELDGENLEKLKVAVNKRLQQLKNECNVKE